MNKKELKNNEKFKDKITSKNCSTLISNYQPLTSNHQPLISDHKGITLIALVITIIVMLILVGVTVTVALDGGLFSQAKDAARKTQIANIKERVQADIWEKEAENNGGELTAEQFQEVLDKYFDGVPETAEELEEKYTNPDYSLGTKEEYGPKVDIKISDLYNGPFAQEPVYADTNKSYIGCYADIDGDENVDGIIYADLAVAGSGDWGSNGYGKYSWTVQTDGLKQYKITGQAKSFWGATRDVIVAVSESGTKDRFYVMALADVDTITRYWYYSAVGKLPSGKLTEEEKDGRIVEFSENDFGTGKENTKYWLDKYGKIEGTSENSKDLWKIIKDQKTYPIVPEGRWFVPSKSEWAAFGWLVTQPRDTANGGIGFGVNWGTYEATGLTRSYWSSSVGSINGSYRPDFEKSEITSFNVDSNASVRLSTTF